MRKIVITQSYTNAETDTFKKYLNEVSRYPILNDKEELMYAERAKNGDKVAMELLVSCNLRFVISVAKQYVDKHSKLEDLVNEGNLGLIEASKRFDYTKGFKFISFAVWWVRNYIIEYKNNQAKAVRLPVHKISEMTKVQKRINNLEQELDREPSISEILESFNGEFDLDEIINITSLIESNEQSLDEVNSDGVAMNDTVISELPASDHLLIKADDSQWIDNLLGVLTDNERYVMTKLYGLDGWASLPLETVGDEIGISREGVRQIRIKCIRKIRNNLKVKNK